MREGVDVMSPDLANGFPVIESKTDGDVFFKC